MDGGASPASPKASQKPKTAPHPQAPSAEPVRAVQCVQCLVLLSLCFRPALTARPRSLAATPRATPGSAGEGPPNAEFCGAVNADGCSSSRDIQGQGLKICEARARLAAQSRSLKSPFRVADGFLQPCDKGLRTGATVAACHLRPARDLTVHASVETLCERGAQPTRFVSICRRSGAPTCGHRLGNASALE